MPVQFIRTGDKCAARWGDKGYEYTYTCGDVKERAEAKRKALDQGYQIGEYKYSLQERYAKLIEFLKNDN